MNYDTENWKALAKQLNQDHGIFSGKLHLYFCILFTLYNVHLSCFYYPVDVAFKVLYQSSGMSDFKDVSCTFKSVARILFTIKYS